ncbi:hypothetical protein [Spirochaeta dissipatitropha]
MKKNVRTILAVSAALLLVLALGSCGLFGSTVVVTVNVTGTDYGGGADVYVGIAKGYALSKTTLDDLEVLEVTQITPSETEQSVAFEVPSQSNYTAFVFHDLNENGEYDEGDTVRMSSEAAISFLEEDITVSIDYNY